MGYLHGVKPTLTGGLDNEQMKISPEAHKEWADKEGKHTVDFNIKPAPASLASRERENLDKDENAEKQSNKTVAAGSHIAPNKRGVPKSKTMGKEETKLKKAVPSGPMGAQSSKGGKGISKSGQELK